MAAIYTLKSPIEAIQFTGENDDEIEKFTGYTDYMLSLIPCQKNDWWIKTPKTIIILSDDEFKSLFTRLKLTDN